MSSQNFSILLSVPSFAFELTFINAFSTKSISSGLKEVERFLSLRSVFVYALFFLVRFFFSAEAGSGCFLLFVFLVVVPVFKCNFSRLASFSDSDSLPLNEQSEVMYSPSDDVEVMLISRISSVGLDDDGKLVQRQNKISSGGDEWKCGGKVPSRQIRLDGLGRKVIGFAKWAVISSLGRNFWAEHVNCS